PVEAERLWERQAEDNVLDRLQKAGLLAPTGDVDKVVQTVLTNLQITNKINLQPAVRARILLTTPLECFTVGHTVVISRGLLDVLPDEASLAAVLAHELANIDLGYAVNTKYAFADRLFFPDTAVLKRLKVTESAAEETAANEKSLEILKNSPYDQKLPQFGLFLRALNARSKDMPNLIHPLLGNRMAQPGKILELATLMENSPQLKPRSMDQVPALPLGGRIKLDPWTDQLELKREGNPPLQFAREKLSFEVTPFFLHLSREPEVEQAANNKVEGE
ncbi:MAG TPA: M48 family metalloprotease, partial [Bryobacteraceae bacterium]|nr:M48 family metalloprotease [Bryobacteraceae bacterium]